MLSARWLALICLLGASGCPDRMIDQPRYDPMEESALLPHDQVAQPPVPGTVARGQLRLDAHLYQGTIDGEPATTFPFEISLDDLRRGRERFDIYCSPCHDRVGSGHGMIVQRGFSQPPSLRDPRLIEAPPGHFFDVMTNGLGRMPSYRSQVSVEDRWRIAAYIRVLQQLEPAPWKETP